MERLRSLSRLDAKELRAKQVNAHLAYLSRIHRQTNKEVANWKKQLNKY